MAKAENRNAIVSISDPAMQSHEVDLNALLGCARRELARRQFVYPKQVAEGKVKENKAETELELMEQVCDFLTHCIFKAVTRGGKSHEGG